MQQYNQYNEAKRIVGSVFYEILNNKCKNKECKEQKKNMISNLKSDSVINKLIEENKWKELSTKKEWVEIVDFAKTIPHLKGINFNSWK